MITDEEPALLEDPIGMITRKWCPCLCPFTSYVHGLTRWSFAQQFSKSILRLPVSR